MPVTREELPLQCSAHEYHALMHQGVGRSEDLVNRFLDQIEQHNNLGLMLNAVLSVCPRDVAISQAKALDGERRQGKPRGELHGIPITVKDCIVTGPSLGMVSSAGSSAIASLQATRNATLVDRLLDAGMILLGKGNLTEFCGLKSENTPTGWSARGRQTLSAYRRDDFLEQDQPWCGASSSEPAVSITAGFAPLGIGTETGGSNVFPASLGGLYGLTLPHDSVPIDGVHRISETFDRIGLMARDPRDLASLVKALVRPDEHLTEPLEYNAAPSESLWGALSIGVLDSEWGTDPSSKGKWGSVQAVNFVVQHMEDLGARVAFPLEDVPDPDDLKHEGETLHSIAYHEFPKVLKDFISNNFEPDAKLTNLADLIAWNEENAAQALPKQFDTQTEPIKCRDGTMTIEKHDMAVSALRQLARNRSMAKYMHEHGLDVVLSSSDATLISFSACAGWPVATVPVGNLTKNDQPWGMFALACDGSVDTLLMFMRAFHGSFNGVKAPETPFE
ncbi:amidase-like protein [Diaporthe sp. PMI_573]|nr:amidase-like protein [Diaporthaceae sp. PMI_573]